MKITKEELKELNKKGSVEIWDNRYKGSEDWFLLEVE